MQQKISRWAIVLTLLLATSVLAGYAVYAQDEAQDVVRAEVCADQVSAAQDSGQESDVPANVKAGAEEPRAHQPDSPRRLEAPERQLADFSGRAMPAPSASASRIAWMRAATVGSQAAATPLHLRHCVFLC